MALGFGWGMLPELQLATGRTPITPFDPAGAVDVVLYWQQWRLRSATLDRVREAVVDAAARELD